MADQDKSKQEKAEGSRETVDANLDDYGADRDRYEEGDEHAGGISNRPLEEEIEDQQELPERGESSDE
jgi:hypothetical protein